MAEEHEPVEGPQLNYEKMDPLLKLSCEELQKRMLEACLIMETEELFSNASPDFRSGFIAGLHRQRWLVEEETEVHAEIFGEGIVDMQ
jgi:hypothetical protein